MTCRLKRCAPGRWSSIASWNQRIPRSSRPSPKKRRCPTRRLPSCERRSMSSRGKWLCRRPPLPLGEAARSAGEGGERADAFVLVGHAHPGPLPAGAGALNTTIILRGTEVIVENESADGRAVQVVTVGRKGQDFLARRGRTLLGTFTGIIDRVRYDDVIPIARVIMDGFVNGSIDRALLVYPRFISTLTQRPEV